MNKESASILGLERKCLQLLSHISLQPKYTVDPVQDDAERLGLAHVFLAFDESATRTVSLSH